MMRRIGCDQGFVGNFKKRREAAAVSVAGKADTAAGGGCVVIPDYGFFFYGKKAPIGCGQGTQEKTSAVCGVIICKGSLPGYRLFSSPTDPENMAAAPPEVLETQSVIRESPFISR